MIPYLFFLDIDDTLAVRRVVSEKNVRAIRRARASGCKVFVNTGRALSYLPDYLDRREFDGFVFGCGSYIVAEGELIYRNSLNSDACVELCRHCEANDRFAALLEGETKLFRFRPSFWQEERDWILGSETEEVARFCAEEAITKITLIGDVDPEADGAWLTSRFDVIFHPDERYAELLPFGCTKATGMRRVAEHYGVPMNRTVMMGDSENDLDPMRAAGIGVAMGNTRPIVQAAADFVSSPASEDGVAVAIDAILAGKIVPKAVE